MKSSPWRVTSNPVGDRTIYRVYRLIDTAEADHSGNREFYGNYVGPKEEALAIAKQLNAMQDFENGLKMVQEAMKVITSGTFFVDITEKSIDIKMFDSKAFKRMFPEHQLTTWGIIQYYTTQQNGITYTCSSRE